MKTFTTLLLLAALLPAARAQVEAPTVESVPVKPIPPTTFGAWTNALTLGNEALSVTLGPDTGRILEIRPAGGKNLLHLNETHDGWTPTTNDTGFVNLGGDWLWPAAQSRWESVTGADWPPPPWVADAPWTGHGWITDDGWRHARMARSYPPPLGIEVQREIQLHPSNAFFRVHQRAARNAEGTVPACLWQISQLDAPDLVIMAVSPLETAIPPGYRFLMNKPPRKTMKPVYDTLVITPDTEGMWKIGTDSRRRWIAGIKDGFLVLEKQTGAHGGREFPDGGCLIEAYISGDGKYVEIESLSDERLLGAEGDALENTIEITVQPVPTGLELKEVVLWVKSIVGEEKEVAPAARPVNTQTR